MCQAWVAQRMGRPSLLQGGRCSEGKTLILRTPFPSTRPQGWKARRDPSRAASPKRLILALLLPGYPATQQGGAHTWGGRRSSSPPAPQRPGEQSAVGSYPRTPRPLSAPCRAKHSAPHLPAPEPLALPQGTSISQSRRKARQSMAGQGPRGLARAGEAQRAECAWGKKDPGRTQASDSQGQAQGGCGLARGSRGGLSSVSRWLPSGEERLGFRVPTPAVGRRRSSQRRAFA